MSRSVWLLVLAGAFWIAIYCQVVHDEATRQACVLACMADDEGPIVTEEECTRWCEE